MRNATVGFVNFIRRCSMTPAARVQAAIELLDQIIEAARGQGAPADRLIAAYFKQRRYAGSKDRRAVRELVYRAVRHCGEIPASGRAAMLALAESDPALRDLFDGSAHGPAPIGASEKPAQHGAAPSWLLDALRASDITGEQAAALMDRAPLDIRVNALKSDPAAIDLPEPGEALAGTPGLRYGAGTRVEEWPHYRDGLIEVQDHGSQLACAAMRAAPGETVIDLCAGAGGKTLALAAAMNNRGTLIACDTDRGRLAKLAPRAERAGAAIADTILLDPGRELEALADHATAADLVLVDAPCSGTGTLRRKPEAKWRITPDALSRYTGVQDRLLDIAAALVRPGGRLGFVTCSLLDDEGAARIKAFLERNPRFAAKTIELPVGSARGDGVRLDPFHHGTDGFFIAMMRAA